MERVPEETSITRPKKAGEDGNARRVLRERVQGAGIADAAGAALREDLINNSILRKALINRLLYGF
jgi:hypothetical protein